MSLDICKLTSNVPMGFEEPTGSCLTYNLQTGHKMRILSALNSLRVGLFALSEKGFTV